VGVIKLPLQIGRSTSTLPVCRRVDFVANDSDWKALRISSIDTTLFVPAISGGLGTKSPPQHRKPRMPKSPVSRLSKALRQPGHPEDDRRLRRMQNGVQVIDILVDMSVQICHVLPPNSFRFEDKNPLRKAEAIFKF
jgi:hypothetical protein